MKKLFLLLFLCFGGYKLTAQTLAPAISKAPNTNTHMDFFIALLIVFAVLILFAALAMLKAFNNLAQEYQNPKPIPLAEKAKRMEYEEWAAVDNSKPGFWTRMLGLKPIEEEKDLMMEHEFDGIVELDNPTPAWFMWLFYSTIAFAFVYMVYYHVLNIGPSQEQEYAIEMEAAEKEKTLRLANSANNIDENSVKEDQSAPVVSAGLAIYNTNCLACHGDKGQGIVGPNLTDEYWIHGGKPGDIFKTIKYGVPEKGMISWEKLLSPKQISDVTNFIKSLKGTNPANAKAPQGDKEA